MFPTWEQNNRPNSLVTHNCFTTSGLLKCVVTFPLTMVIVLSATLCSSWITVYASSLVSARVIMAKGVLSKVNSPSSSPASSEPHMIDVCFVVRGSLFSTPFSNAVTVVDTRDSVLFQKDRIGPQVTDFPLDDLGTEYQELQGYFHLTLVYPQMLTG
mmetsp:Transcript_12105/g.12152  ORF Transcript_12105/g.12152 Transcript_12105/m.12152 type:complete len:157 (-) Transcript_12105:647-1117(-)